MTVIIPPGYAQLVLGFSCANVVTGRTAIVTGWGAPAGPGAVPIDEWVESIADGIDGWVTELFDTQVTLDTIYAQTATASVQAEVSYAGGQTFDDPPPNVSTLCNYSTLSKGRRGRGRSYLYGVLGEGDITPGGNIQSARRDSIQVNWTGLLDFVSTAHPTPAIDQVILQNPTPTVNPPNNPTPPISPPPVVTNQTVSGRVATQRRRLRR